MALKKFYIRLSRTKRLSFGATVFFMVVISGALVVVGLFGSAILPDKYYFDGSRIANLMVSGPGFEAAPNSYTNTAAFFSLFTTSGTAVSIIGVLFSLLAIIVPLHLSGLREVPWVIGVPVIGWCVILMVYLGQPSKELIVAILMLLLLWLGNTRRGLAAWTLMAVLYALFFRQYWFIFLSLFWGAYIINRWLRSPMAWFFYGLICYAVLAVAFDYFLGGSLTSVRNSINVNREFDPNSVSLITSIVPGDGPMVGWLNGVLITMLLFVPLPLLSLGGAQHIFAFLSIPFGFWISYDSITRLRRASMVTVRAAAAARVVFCFPLVQGLFEPDYGSFLKHLAPLFPLMLYLWALALHVGEMPDGSHAISIKL